MTPFIDTSSQTWVMTRKLARERIEKLRSDLEITGVEPEALRGEIAGLRWLLRTVEPDAPITEPTGTDYMKTGAPTG